LSKIVREGQDGKMAKWQDGKPRVAGSRVAGMAIAPLPPCSLASFPFELLYPLQDHKTADDQTTRPPDVKTPDIQEILTEAQKQRDEIIKEAENCAKEIMDGAQREAENLRKKGYDDGFTTGLKKLEKQISSIAELAMNITKEIKEAKEKVLNDLEPEIIQMVLSVSKKLIASELSLNHNAILNIVKEAIQVVKEKKNLIIRINKNELEVLRKFKEELFYSEEGIENLQIEGDEEIEPGGCIIETESKVIDASLETRLSEVTKSFLSCMGERNSEFGIYP